MAALPAAFGNLLPRAYGDCNFRGALSLAGLGTGLLTTLLFCLPPLLDVRTVRPVLVLRRLVEQGRAGIRGVVCALVGAPAATGDRRGCGCGAGRQLRGHCLIPRKWAAGSRFCSSVALVVLLVLAGVALWTLRLAAESREAAICLPRCGMGWRTSTGPAISRRRCWRRWARA